MRMGQGVRTGLGHWGITCVLQTQFSSFLLDFDGCKLFVLFCWLLVGSFGQYKQYKEDKE